jgi:DNA processing protein
MVLSMLVEPNDPVTGRLLAQVGAVEVLRLAERNGEVSGLDSVDMPVWRDHFNTSDVRSITERLSQTHQSGVRALIPGDAHWPGALNDLGEAAPYVLWVRGASSFLSRPLRDFVTITGARASTSYGDHVARELAASVAADDRVVVAGGGYGIEGVAHQTALATGGDPIAVLANGVDRPYPAGHRDLLDRVADVGVLVSEVPPGTVPTRHRFIARARLMAALSSATVLVEAGFRSGSLAVAHRASELGRGVGAVPGPVTSASSAGPHSLLQTGVASLVADAADLSGLAEHQGSRQASALRAGLGGGRVRRSASEPARTL